MSGIEVLGIVSAGVQLLESIQKLKAFCGNVKNAPAPLHDLIFDLETMGLCLDQLERSHSTGDPLLLRRCLDRCRVSTSRIHVIVDRIQNMSAKGALISKFYTAFKDPDIAGLLNELEKTKSTLSLSLITYNSQNHSTMESAQLSQMKLHSMQLDLIWTQTQANNIALAKMLGQLGHDANTRNSHGQAPEELIQQDIAPNRAKSSRKKQPKHYTIRLPRWICSQIWNVSLTRAQSGWEVNLRTDMPRHASSEVFRRCMIGDLTTVRRMIAQGEASLFDRSADMVLIGPSSYYGSHDDSGRRLLWIAAYNGRVELFDWLFREIGYSGIDFDELASLIRYAPISITASDSIFRTSLEHGAESADLDLAASDDCKFLSYMREHQLEAILNSTDLLPPQRLAQEVFPHVCGRDDFITAGLFLRLVRLTSSSSELANLVEAKSRFSVLHLVATMLASASLTPGVDSSDIEGWLTIARTALRYGMPASTIGARSTVNQTAFLHLVDELYQRGHRWASHVVRIWLQTIQEAGVDLLEYGAREHDLWRSLQNENASQALRQFHLEYSNTPDQWSIKVSTTLTTVPLYRLERLPGSFDDYSLCTTEYICWEPQDCDEVNHSWQHIRNVTTSRPRCDAFSVGEHTRPDDGLTGAEVAPKDDTNLAALLSSRKPRSCTLRPRSASVPARRRSRYNPNDYQNIPIPVWHPTVHFCVSTMAYECYQSNWSTIRSCANGRCYLDREVDAAQASSEWLCNSFVADVRDCLVGFVGESSALSQSRPSLRLHTGKKDCPQGCGKVDLGLWKFNVPKDMLGYYPR